MLRGKAFAHPGHHSQLMTSSKGGVENDIKYVKNNFWPLFKEKQKALGREVPHFEDLPGELQR